MQSECRATIDKNLERFGVLCHGNLTIQALAFKYRSELESRLFCSDMLIQVMHTCIPHALPKETTVLG